MKLFPKLEKFGQNKMGSVRGMRHTRSEHDADNKQTVVMLGGVGED